METKDIFIDFQSDAFRNLCRQHPIQTLSLFGSFAKGTFSEDSDIDLLVEFNGRLGLIYFMQIENQFSDFFGRNVDLVSKNGLSPYLKDEILNSAKVIYEAA